MRTELEKLEQIDAYLNGEMSPNEAEEFGRMLEADPVLGEAVKYQQMLVQAVSRQALSAEISSVTAALATSATTLNTIIWTISSLTVAGCVAFGVYHFNSSSEQPDKPSVTPAITAVVAEPQLKEVESNEVLPELPETTFSSKHNYVEDEDDFINVNVHFKPKDREHILMSTPIAEVPQNDNLEYESTKEIYINKSAYAAFPGGHLSLKKYIDKNLYYPRTASSKNIEGIVRVDFQIDKKGAISSIEAMCIQMNEKGQEPFSEMKKIMNKKIENLFIGNATHVLRTMPYWETAKGTDGKPIKSLQRMYFHYDLENGCSAYQLNEEIIGRARMLD